MTIRIPATATDTNRWSTIDLPTQHDGSLALGSVKTCRQGGQRAILALILAYDSNKDAF
jgi:hypothetical protein